MDLFFLKIWLKEWFIYGTLLRSKIFLIYVSENMVIGIKYGSAYINLTIEIYDKDQVWAELLS